MPRPADGRSECNVGLRIGGAVAQRCGALQRANSLSRYLWERSICAVSGDAECDDRRSAGGRERGESPRHPDATRRQSNCPDTRRWRSEASHAFPVNRPDGDLRALLLRSNDIDGRPRRSLARCAQSGRRSGRQNRRRDRETDESDECCGARHLLVIGTEPRVRDPEWRLRRCSAAASRDSPGALAS